MDSFPFQELVGLLVFVIIALSQMWGAYQEKRKRSREIEERWRREQDSARNRSEPFPESAGQAGEPGPGEKSPEEALRDFLEALGAPPVEEAPVPPPLPRPVPQGEPPAAAETPAARPDSWEQSTAWDEPLAPREPEANPYSHAVPVSAPMLSADELLDEAMAVARMDRGAAAHLPASSAPATPPARGESDGAGLAALLRDRASIQRAILLNEILGKPRAFDPHRA